MNNQPRYQHTNNGEFKQWMGVKAVFGHLHGFRQIPNSNPPAHSVRISMPQGHGENMRYTAMELVITSLPVYHLLSEQADKINSESVKSTLTFNFYGSHPKAYVLKNKDGTPKVNDDGDLELRAFIAGNLDHISYLKVDSIVVHGKNKDNEIPAKTSGIESPQKPARKAKA